MNKHELRLLSETLGANLRYQRDRTGLTQAGLAKKAKLTTSYISLIERGHRIPSIPCLVAISDVMKINVKVLIP